MTMILTGPDRTRPAGLARRAIGAAARAVGAVLRERRIRRDIAHLRALPDGMLRDIGLHRSEVEAVTRLGREGFSAR